MIGITAALRGLTSSRGVTPGFAIPPTYVSMVRAAGAIPVLLTPIPPDQVPSLLDRLDGVILSGGGDVDPRRYNGKDHPTIYDVDGERDEFEVALSRAAAALRLPTLCICRGMQVMNVAFGGTLIEDVPSRVGEAIAHRVGGEGANRVQHAVELTPDSALARATGRTSLQVNSVHHQAVDALGSGLVASGRSPDGVIEALEPADPSWPMWAVQWHPERLGVDDGPSIGLFQALASAAGR